VVQSVTEVDLTGCAEEEGSGVLAELGSMPCLRSLVLPASCAERAVDAEAVCGLTTLTKLRFRETRAMEYDEDDEPVDEVVGEWVLDFEQADDAELSQPQAVCRRDGQASAGAEQPDGSHRSTSTSATLPRGPRGCSQCKSSNRVLEGLGKSRGTACTYREIPASI
jgi:hypothetical protein